METDASNPKHNFTECSKLDQETIRRKMRSTSQSAGFRPVVPGLCCAFGLSLSRLIFL